MQALLSNLLAGKPIEALLSEVQISHAWDALRCGLQLLDLPGVQDADRFRGNVAEARISACDTVMVVADIERSGARQAADGGPVGGRRFVIEQPRAPVGRWRYAWCSGHTSVAHSVTSVLLLGLCCRFLSDATPQEQAQRLLEHDAALLQLQVSWAVLVETEESDRNLIGTA